MSLTLSIVSSFAGDYAKDPLLPRVSTLPLPPSTIDIPTRTATFVAPISTILTNTSTTGWLLAVTSLVTVFGLFVGRGIVCSRASPLARECSLEPLKSGPFDFPETNNSSDEEGADENNNGTQSCDLSDEDWDSDDDEGKDDDHDDGDGDGDSDDSGPPDDEPEPSVDDPIDGDLPSPAPVPINRRFIVLLCLVKLRMQLGLKYLLA
ncbi:hypothetical protein H0H87_004883 [Tephrocybe sp. NHM501043]|nr:hypothetical protein H0H87_004883 [Tephrocybe sp. NHM501043]